MTLPEDHQIAQVMAGVARIKFEALAATAAASHNAVLAAIDQHHADRDAMDAAMQLWLTCLVETARRESKLGESWTHIVPVENPF